MKIDLLRATPSELQSSSSDGTLTKLDLVRQCHQQMLEHNPGLKAVISISPLSYNEKIASQLDKERQEGSVRSPLHGIPLIIKV